MITEEVRLFVLMIIRLIFRRNREMEVAHARRVHWYCLLMLRLLQQRNNQRGLYCQAIVGYNEQVLGALLRGEERPTREHLRVNARSLRRLVELCRRNRKRSGWCVELEVILFLFWLASGAAYRIVGATFDIPRTTIHHTVHKTLDLVLTLLPTVVRLPSEENLDRIGRGFERRANSTVFRQCVGAIDGCHVRINCPNNLHDQYYNRKQFYSINLQGLVDNTGLFIDIVSGFPGSVHDSRVFRSSALFQRRLYPPEGYFILGDSGYPCRRDPVAIITPFREPLTPEQRAFNHALSQARMVVECTFGRLKARWRSIFTKALEVSITTAVKVIVACIMMHNICTTQGDIIAMNVRVPALPPRRIRREERDAHDLRNLFLLIFTIEQMNREQ